MNPRLAYLLYDGSCPFCTRNVRWLMRWLITTYNIEIRAVQDPWVQAHLLTPDIAALKEIKFIDESGTVYGGANALIHVMRRSPKTRWLAQCLAQPMVYPVMSRLYQWISDNRKILP